MQGTPGFSGINSHGTGGGGGGGFTVAQNGLSKMGGTTVVLGQDVGESGNPAMLLSDREIPMAGFGLLMSGDGRLWVGDQTAETYLLGTPQLRVRSAIAGESGSMFELSSPGGSPVFDNGIFFATDNAPVFIDAGLPSANAVFLMKSTTDPDPDTGGTTVNFYLASTNSQDDSEITDQEVMAFVPESVSGLMPTVDVRFRLVVGDYVSDDPSYATGLNSALISLGQGEGVGFSAVFAAGNTVVDPGNSADGTDLGYALQVWDAGSTNTVAALGSPNVGYGYALVDQFDGSSVVSFKRIPQGRDQFATKINIDSNNWVMDMTDAGTFTFTTLTGTGFNFVASSDVGTNGADFRIGGSFSAFSELVGDPVGTILVRGGNEIQADTTASDIVQYGGYFTSIGTKSAGTNNQINVALYATVGEGDVNIAGIFNGNVQVTPFGVTYVDTGESLQVLGNMLINNTQPINTLAVAANTTANGSFGTLNLDTNNNFSYYSKFGLTEVANSWGFFVQTDQYDNNGYENGLIDFEAGYHFATGTFDAFFTGGIITRLSTYLDSDSRMDLGSNSANYGAALFVSNNMVPNGSGVGSLTLVGDGTVPMPIVVARTDFNNGNTVTVSGGLGMAGFLSDLTSGSGGGELDIFTDFYAGAGVREGGFSIGTRYGFYVTDLHAIGLIGTTYGFYSAGVNDTNFFAGGLTTTAPAGSTSGKWKLGAFGGGAIVPTDSIVVTIDGTNYLIAAKAQ